LLKRLGTVLPLIVLVSCGGDDETVVNVQSGVPVTSNFNGLYEAVFRTYTLRCSSGYSNEIQGFATRVLVDHDSSTLQIFAGSDELYEGVVDNAGNFSATETFNSTIEGQYSVTYKYTLSGSFNETGWTGKFTSRGTVIGNPGTCSSETTFSGNIIQ